MAEKRMTLLHWRRRRAVYLRCLPWLLIFYVGAGAGQGSGPADFGWLNHVIIGGWLLFWLGVIVYPVALVVLLVWHLWAPDSDAGEESRDGVQKLTAVARWAVGIHLGLTLLVTLIFVFK
jgi:hypothetical protein